MHRLPFHNASLDRLVFQRTPRILLLFGKQLIIHRHNGEEREGDDGREKRGGGDVELEREGRGVFYKFTNEW